MEWATLWFFLFPIIYSLHELEELIGFKQRKKQDIKKFPKKLWAFLTKLSFAKFFKAILVETFLMLQIRIGSRYVGSSFWFAVSIVFTTHFLFHLLQALFLKNWSLWAKSSLVLLPIASFFSVKAFPELYSEHFLRELLIAGVLMILFFNFLIFFFPMKKDCFLGEKS